MRLSISDLDAVAEAILRFLQAWRTRSPSPGARVIDRSDTPTGALVEIVEHVPRGEGLPVIWVGVSTPAPADLLVIPRKRRQSKPAGKPPVLSYPRPFHRDPVIKHLSHGDAVHFHLLLPGQHTSTTRAEREETYPMCLGCHRPFRPLTDGYGYCCPACERGDRHRVNFFRRAPTQAVLEQAMLCSRIVRPKLRRLRKIHGTEAPGRHLKPTVNLVACDEDKEGLFLQLAIYAARVGKVSVDVEEEAFDRFKRKFSSSVGWLSQNLLQGQEQIKVQHEILIDAWSKIWGEKKGSGYQVPDKSDGFSRYARTIIAKRKLSHQQTGDTSSFSREQELPTPKEAAKSVGIRRWTFYKLMTRGIIPARKIGKVWKLQETWRNAAKDWKRKEAERRTTADANKGFAQTWALKRRVPLASATTQIKRLRQQGNSTQTIAAKIGHKWIKKALRPLSERIDKP